MPATQAELAEISRQNGRKSKGPVTEVGKEKTRGNSLQHGLTATTLIPIAAPGEKPGDYQKRLDFWIGDIQPQNVLELAAVERGCRASWKLDRVARYEDAAAARRNLVPTEQTPEDGQKSNRQWAEHLGKRLMFMISFAYDYGEVAPKPTAPDIYDDAPGDADALSRFKEGVEWLIRTWHEVIPDLPVEGQPPPKGADVFIKRQQLRALRMLGIPTGDPPPKQPLIEAARAELVRLEARLAEFATHIRARIDADMSLFQATPNSELLIRYEASAERSLHKAIDTLIKLRKKPELFALRDSEPVTAPAAVVEPTPATPEIAKKPEKTPPSSVNRPAPNEPSRNDGLNPDSTPQSRHEEAPKTEKRLC